MGARFAMMRLGGTEGIVRSSQAGLHHGQMSASGGRQQPEASMRLGDAEVKTRGSLAVIERIRQLRWANVGVRSRNMCFPFAEFS